VGDSTTFEAAEARLTSSRAILTEGFFPSRRMEQKKRLMKFPCHGIRRRMPPAISQKRETGR